MSDPFAQPPQVPPGVGSGSAVVPCENGVRFWAMILDVLLAVVTCGIGWIIWDVVLWSQSTSPAKKMLGLRVVDLSTGAPATMQQMLLREGLGKIVLGTLTGVLFLVSGVLILTTPTRQGAWDYLAKTTVIKEK